MNKFINHIIIFITTYAGAAESHLAPKRVLISQVVAHPALDKTTQGIIDALKENSFVGEETLTLRVESAQANAALAQQIAKKFTSQKPDIVIGVGTLSAQSFIKAATADDVKVVFSSITDPESAHLTEVKNITGISNFVDLEPQLLLFKKLQPNLKRLGILYSPGELNSVSIVKKLETLCLRLGISLVKQSVTKSSDIPQNALRLAKGVDAIFISNDNTVLSGLKSVVKAAFTVGIPVYVSDTDAVELGALAALGPNQYEIGKQTGNMVAKLLKSEAKELPRIEFPQKTDLYLNLETAKKLNISIPKDLLKSATKVIPEAQV